ncbi:MAG: peptidylprolyl isomerase [Chloroflexota bacterium]
MAGSRWQNPKSKIQNPKLFEEFMAEKKDSQSPQSVARKRAEEKQRQQAQQNRIIAIIGGVLAVVVIAYIVLQFVNQEQAGSEGVTVEGERPLATLQPGARNGYYQSAPEMTLDTAKSYEAVIQTNKGELRLRLFDDEAPLTVNNFIFLATQGFYDNTTFHRVITDFMAQGGDPTGTGSGGPGYQFADETDNGLTFDRRGLLAMANAGPGTNGSQFFITFVETPWLDGNHTIFGELIEGDDVLASITIREPGADAAAADVIERIDIVEVPSQ